MINSVSIRITGKEITSAITAFGDSTVTIWGGTSKSEAFYIHGNLQHIKELGEKIVRAAVEALEEDVREKLEAINEIKARDFKGHEEFFKDFTEGGE